MANTAIKKKSKPRMVSLFSGCGGLDLGFARAGFRVVWANDFDSDAQAVYNLNHKLGKHEVEIDPRDILTVDENEIPDADILTAGFPCQPFSNAGSRKGVHDSRGMLYKECLRIIAKKMPKVIVFENVKGLLSTKYIDGRKLPDVIKDDLSTIGNVGYEVVYSLINASDHGVPQNRQRVFFVGIRKDLGLGKFVFPDKQSKVNLTVGDVLNMPDGLPNQEYWAYSPQALEMVEQISEGGSWKDVPYKNLAPRFQRIRDDMKKYRSPNFYRRFSRTEICGTITASAQPENCGITHPTENRRYTIREIARFQSFPDDFIFLDDSLKNIVAAYKVIGNAVPPNLAHSIASAIMEQVFKGDEVCFMNTDKAYLLGLIIGGGIFGNAETMFRIRLPYRQWGSISHNPQRAGQISQDIMRVVSPYFRTIYSLNISFEASDREWNILCEGDLTDVQNDLRSYGIDPVGDIRQTAGISGVVPLLVDDNLKRRFIAGLADTIGSTNPNHRRFSDEVQILSFEIAGFNFSFVCDLCRLLYSVNCIPDQILWNHPNFHAGNNPYYRSWTKGFKLRVQLDQYAVYGAFAFRSRAESAQQNLERQQQTHQAIPCPERDMSVTPSCIHPAENDGRLPPCIRGGHYLHNRHVCAVLGCEHAPYEKVTALFRNVGEYINPFPILYKDKISQIEQVISDDTLLNGRRYNISVVSIQSLYSQFQSNSNLLIYGSRADTGYPITEVMQAIAFIVANDAELNGTRPRGNFTTLIERHLETNPNVTVEMRRPDLLTPLILLGNGRGALIGARNPHVYSQLVRFSPDNEYKLCVRPITEEDLQNA